LFRHQLVESRINFGHSYHHGIHAFGGANRDAQRLPPDFQLAAVACSDSKNEVGCGQHQAGGVGQQDLEVGDAIAIHVTLVLGSAYSHCTHYWAPTSAKTLFRHLLPWQEFPG
jgi:hypothetical protein